MDHGKAYFYVTNGAVWTLVCQSEFQCVPHSHLASDDVHAYHYCDPDGILLRRPATELVI